MELDEELARLKREIAVLKEKRSLLEAEIEEEITSEVNAGVARFTEWLQRGSDREEDATED
jgi:hypothetical protein